MACLAHTSECDNDTKIARLVWPRGKVPRSNATIAYFERRRRWLSGGALNPMRGSR
jgi:hypothetical protein